MNKKKTLFFVPNRILTKNFLVFLDFLDFLDFPVFLFFPGANFFTCPRLARSISSLSSGDVLDRSG